MEKYILTSGFIEDHHSIASAIKAIREDESKSRGSVIKLFSHFYDKVSSHFKAEEALYSALLSARSKSPPITQSIINEHKDIMERIEKLRFDLDDLGDDNINFYISQKLDALFLALERHKNIEERVFYPEIESSFSNDEKLCFAGKRKDVRK